MEIDRRKEVTEILEHLGHKKEALEMAEGRKKFELAFEVGDQRMVEYASTKEEFAQVGDWAFSENFDMAEKAFLNAKNDEKLLHLYIKYDKKEQLRKYMDSDSALMRIEAGFYLKEYNFCINVLHKVNRFAEAAVFAKNHHPVREEECFTKWKEFLLRDGEEEANKTSPITIADVACGTGEFVKRAKDRLTQDLGHGGLVFYGIEPCPQMLAEAKQKDECVHWVESSAEALPLKDESVSISA